MAVNLNQGGQVSMTVTGEDHSLNQDPDFNVCLFSTWNWKQPTPAPIEERFPRYLNIDSSIVFKENKVETNAEDSYIHIVYKLSKVVVTLGSAI